MLNSKTLRDWLLYEMFIEDVDAGKQEPMTFMEFKDSLLIEYDMEAGYWNTKILQWTDRYKQINSMHQLIRLANDEELYAAWIYVVPDEPNDADFLYIATNDGSFNDAFKLFKKLICDNGYLLGPVEQWED